MAAVGLFRFCLNVGSLWQPRGFQCASNVWIRIGLAFQTDLAAEVHVASMYCRFRYGLKPRNLLGVQLDYVCNLLYGQLEKQIA